MNVRVTVLLIVAAIAVGVVAYINPFKDAPEAQDDSPWFFQVAEEDIEVIEVNHQGEGVRFFKADPERYLWEFEDPAGIPPNRDRWGGITLLLSGPRTRRDLTPSNQIIDDPAEYGLDNPITIVKVGLTHNRNLEFRLGHETTDGYHHYGQVSGFPQLFIIADSWGDVIARLATEPPMPRWYEDHDPESIVEVNIFEGDRFADDTRQVSFELEDEGWFVKDSSKDEEALPVDTEIWGEVVPLLGRPSGISVAVRAVDDRDYTPWGIRDDSPAVELRFLGVSDLGTEFTDGNTFVIGSKTPDGRGYYAQHVTEDVLNPVLFIEAQWVDKLFGLADDIPYAQQTESQTATQSN